MRTADQLRGLFQSGAAVTLGIVGNSIGEGYYATNYALIATNPDNPAIGSWANGLRAWLKATNSGSDVLNESHSGWWLQMHIDGGTLATFPTSPPPDAILVPLQINDYCGATYGRPWAEFTANLRSVVQGIIDLGSTPIVVLENDIGRVAPRTDGRTFLDFITEASAVAVEKGCPLIDCYTAFHEAIVAAGGYAGTGLYYDDLHPNQAGHDLLLELHSDWWSIPAYSVPPLDLSPEMPSPSLWLRGWESMPFARVWGGGAKWQVYDGDLARFRIAPIKRLN